MKRDSSSREDAMARLNSQLPITTKVEYADIVIDNSGLPQDLEVQVDALVKRLHKEAGWTWRLTWLFPPLAVVSAAWTLGWKAVKRQKRRSKRSNP